jgi:hypothetical protein
MSKHNKVNPGQYHQAGRMTPDEAARQRTRIQQVSPREDQAGQPDGEAEDATTPHIPSPDEAPARGGAITRTARRKAAARR